MISTLTREAVKYDVNSVIDLARHHGDEELLWWIEDFHVSRCNTGPEDGVAELEDYVDNGNDGGGDGDTPDAPLTRGRWDRTANL